MKTQRAREGIHINPGINKIQGHTSNVKKEKQSSQYKCPEIKHSHSLLKQYLFYFKKSLLLTQLKKN